MRSNEVALYAVRRILQRASLSAKPLYHISRMAADARGFGVHRDDCIWCSTHHRGSPAVRIPQIGRTTLGNDRLWLPESAFPINT